MRRCLPLLLAGCAPEGVVVFPDGSATVRLDADAADARRLTDALADDSGADVPPRDVPSGLVDRAPPPIDTDGGVAPACGERARLEDPAGDYIVVGNLEGGAFVVELDAPLRALGLLSAGPLRVHLTGAHRAALTRVLVVGPSASDAVVEGVDPLRVERVRGAPAQLADVDGVPVMTCAAGCDALRPPREWGCNSRQQVFGFFTARLGEGRRWALLQRETLQGLRVRASAGGCCL